MISTSIARNDYITKTLDRDVAHVFEAQRIIVEKNVYVQGKQLRVKKGSKGAISRHTGRLLSSLSSPVYVVSNTGNGWVVKSQIMLYMRFLDMRKRGNRQIYNRQLWGILYRNTFPSIKYEFGNYTADLLGMALQRAANIK